MRSWTRGHTILTDWADSPLVPTMELRTTLLSMAVERCNAHTLLLPLATGLFTKPAQRFKWQIGRCQAAVHEAFRGIRPPDRVGRRRGRGLDSGIGPKIANKNRQTDTSGLE